MGFNMISDVQVVRPYSLLRHEESKSWAQHDK